jgi:hypothetical protein
MAGNIQVLFDGDVYDNDDDGNGGGGLRQSKFQAEHLL